MSFKRFVRVACYLAFFLLLAGSLAAVVAQVGMVAFDAVSLIWAADSKATLRSAITWFFYLVPTAVVFFLLLLLECSARDLLKVEDDVTK